jgi:hypothetical protein
MWKLISLYSHLYEQLFIIHLPPNGSDLPPHTLLTPLDHSVDSLKLQPSPSNQDTTQHSNVSHLDLPSTTAGNPSCSIFQSIIPNSTSRKPTTDHEITLAAIGLPLSRQQPEANLIDDPHLLVAFQSYSKPLVPTTIKQSIIPVTATDDGPKPNHPHTLGGSQLSIGEEDLGDYITGLGDLDDAFDAPNPSAQNNLEADGDKSNNAGADVAQSKLPIEQTKQRKPSIELRKQRKHRIRRFEPVLPIDDLSSCLNIGAHDDTPQPAYGFINLVEVLIDYDHSIVPSCAPFDSSF